MQTFNPYGFLAMLALIIVAGCNPKTPSNSPPIDDNKPPIDDNKPPIDDNKPPIDDNKPPIDNGILSVDFGPGPIFNLVPFLDVPATHVGYYNLHYVPAKMIDTYKQDVLKAGTWIPNLEASPVSNLPFYTDPFVLDIRASPLHFRAQKLEFTPITLDFTDLRSATLKHEETTYPLFRDMGYTLPFDAWYEQDYDITAHNQKADDAYKLKPNEEFYVIIIGSFTYKGAHTFIPININGLDHFKFTLQGGRRS
ncbi:hypothetical protein [Entomospira culicis]|uniref:Uncharacterized protein n=1 Tax=Entomospira culicis TaxID=2719989 RepID=A0A968KV36_9SPIO|nr:hypothetical protein [Entomospira culicis]NIZ19340.1 hypothetical protein [Entomospira culicis]NIZ69755.1 hypothetical protein [Entomospira culicis]WDI36866.1 hypothetical protein PVA46_05945 [Entomospira culicis]WDI38495.1 hypothetical protein PVA47_05955 [Entomospira culicis]